MNRIILGLVFLLSCSGAVEAQEQNSEGMRFFEGTFEEALQLAKKENKLIFMDCYGPWCGPCAQMVRLIFPLKEVGDFYNEHFINMKRDMEKGEGKTLCKRYNVVSYPTWLFINDKGYVVLSSSGFKKVEEFLAMGKEALNSSRVGDEERFLGGEREETFVKKYLNDLLKMRQADKMEQGLEKLAEEQGGKILDDADYWKVYVVSGSNLDSPLAMYLVEERERLYKLYGEEDVNQKIRNLYASIPRVFSLCDAGAKDTKVLNKEKFEAHVQLMKSRKVPDYKGLKNEILFIVELWNKEYDKAYALGEKNLKKAGARQLCNWAALGERLMRDEVARKQLIPWIDRALKLNDEAEFKKECQEIRHDLETSSHPSFKSKRKSIPVRGYQY